VDLDTGIAVSDDRVYIAHVERLNAAPVELDVAFGH
jgi:hypothetical protein